jgi:hypothetical protein
VHVVLTNGCGEQEITELMTCTSEGEIDTSCDEPPAWEMTRWTPRGDGMVLNGRAVITMHRFAARSLANSLEEDPPECNGPLYFPIPWRWDLVAIDHAGRWVGSLDPDQWAGDDPMSIEIREPADPCNWDWTYYGDRGWFHPERFEVVATRPIDASDVEGHHRLTEAELSRDGTVLVHETAASQLYESGGFMDLPEDVHSQLDLENLADGSTTRLDLPLRPYDRQAVGDVRWGAGRTTLMMTGCDRTALPESRCGLFSIDVETGEVGLVQPDFVPLQFVEPYDVDRGWDVQCAPATCVPPPSCGPYMVRIGFFCHSDWDDDGIADRFDNCPEHHNPGQEDSDGNGTGDACDVPQPDTDGDGTPDLLDNCRYDPNPDQADSDDDGIGDACDEHPEDPSNGSACTTTTVSVGYRAEVINTFPLADRLEGTFCYNDDRVRVDPAQWTHAPSIPVVPGGLPLAVADTVIRLLAVDRNVTGTGPIEVRGLEDGSVVVQATATFGACLNLVPGGWGKLIAKASKWLGKFTNKIAKWISKAVEKLALDSVDKAAVEALIRTLLSVLGVEKCFTVWTPRLALRLHPGGAVTDLSFFQNGRFGYSAAGGTGVDPSQPLGMAAAQLMADEPTAAAAATSAGDGIFTVGTDIDPGLYRAAAPTADCAWWRLSGLEDSIDDVIANDATSHPAIVAVDAGDEAFESDGCGTWQLLGPEPFTASPTTDAPDGVYRVGIDMAPGVWQTSVGDPACIWERRSGFGGTDDDVLEQAGSHWPQTVVIEPGDAGFASWDCGTWTFVADDGGGTDGGGTDGGGTDGGGTDGGGTDGGGTDGGGTDGGGTGGGGTGGGGTGGGTDGGGTGGGGTGGGGGGQPPAPPTTPPTGGSSLVAAARPSQVAPGGEVTLTSPAAFAPGSEVEVHLARSRQGATATVVATATAGPDGKVSHIFTVPAGTPAGVYHLVLLGEDGDGNAVRTVAAIAVVPARAASAPQAERAAAAAGNDPLPPVRDLTASACPADQVQSAFTDVDPTDPGRLAIDCLLEYEVTGGRTRTTYEPDGVVRRDQMASFLVRFADHVDPTLLPATGPPFTDVPASNPHREAVSRLTRAGIVVGTTATTFDPAGSVTREQAALLIGRLLNTVFGQEPDGGAFCSRVADHFADDDGRLSEPCISGLADVQIIRGTGPATYRPADPVTRRQMATLLMRTMDLLVSEGLAEAP